jgi:hypothetical protein
VKSNESEEQERSRCSQPKSQLPPIEMKVAVARQHAGRGCRYFRPGKRSLDSRGQFGRRLDRSQFAQLIFNLGKVVVHVDGKFFFNVVSA